MKDMQDVSGQHREARNAGLMVFADDRGFWCCDRADQETPLNAEPLEDKAAVTRFARAHATKRAASAEKVEQAQRAEQRSAPAVINEQTADARDDG